MTDAQEAHLERIITMVADDLQTKYRAGQQEHGGDIWLKPGMLDHAIEEVLDLIVYLYTLRDQLRHAAEQGYGHGV